MDDHFLEVIRAPFVAKLTSSTLTSGTYYYDWTEQAFNVSTGAYQDATPPRSGTGSTSPMVAPAVEANNANVTTPVYVWLKLRGMVGGTPWYEFVAPGVSSSSGSTLTVASVNPGSGDSTTSIASVTTLDVDLTSGGALTGGAGTATISFQSASSTHAGMMTTGAQTFAGAKLFISSISCEASGFFGCDVGGTNYATAHINISASGLADVGSTKVVTLLPLETTLIGGLTTGASFRIIAEDDTPTGNRMSLDWDNANSGFVFGGKAGGYPNLILSNAGTTTAGWTGTFTVVTSVNFALNTTTTKTVTVQSGLITNVA